VKNTGAVRCAPTQPASASSKRIEVERDIDRPSVRRPQQRGVVDGDVEREHGPRADRDAVGDQVVEPQRRARSPEDLLLRAGVDVVAKDVEHVELEIDPRPQALLAEQVPRIKLPAGAEALLRAHRRDEQRERHAQAELEAVVEVHRAVQRRRQPGGDLVIGEPRRRELEADVLVGKLRVRRVGGEQRDNQKGSHRRVLDGVLRTREATGTRTAGGSTTTGIALNA
jgi:hypothetical protein